MDRPDPTPPEAELQDYENAKREMVGLAEACEQLNYARAAASVNLGLAFDPLPFDVSLRIDDEGYVKVRIVLDLPTKPADGH